MARFIVALWAICFFCVKADLALSQTPDATQPQAEEVQPEQPPSDDEAPPAAEGEDLMGPDGGVPSDDPNGEAPPDDMSLGEIPEIKTTELTPDTAKRAIDVFVLVRDKYADANLEDYENLQDFVDQTEQGKLFDADVKAAGFATVTDWNIAITSVSYAYGALIDDQTADIKLQIEDIRKDATIAQDMKDKAIASLTAMIPSDGNRKIVQDLINDPAYGEKLKLLDEIEE